MTAARASRAVALGLPLVLLTGCGFKGAQSFPLPGGEGTGSDTYELTLEFEDVLDLVPQSSVKVNDVSVGSVKDIQLRDYTAVVTVSVRDDVKLPADTDGSLRQTSLLGEKFVSLDPPDGDTSQGTLKDGDVIPLARTQRSVEIEEVLSALSLVLNGGSLEQLQVINRELTAALKGREPQVRDVLNQLNAFVGGLDDQKADIVRALDSLDRLTKRLADQRGVLATALQDIPPGLKVLSDQRAQLTTLLQRLADLGDVSKRVIDQSKTATVQDLQALQPILQGLNDAGTALPQGLELLLTYPFPKTIETGIRGDYANLFVTVDAQSILNNPSPLGGGGTPAPPTLPPVTAPTLPPVTVPTLPPVTVPTLPGITLAPGITVPPLTVPSLAPGAAGGSSGGSLTDMLLGGLR